MYKVIEFKNEIEYQKEFLDLPKKLYSKNELMQNENEERQILEEKHMLSKYFTIHRFLVINENKEAFARCIITFYPEDKNAYVGFFECVKDKKVSKMLLDYVEKYIKSEGYENIIGPLNCSFWIGYRFKTNYFGHPYTSEPYNKEYYLDMFKEAGYETYQEYSSNTFLRIEKNQQNDKFSKRLELMREKGYIFKQPDDDTFEDNLRTIGRLILDLYSHFPGYKAITEDEFFELYKDLKKIIKYDMVKLAYYNDEMVGFFVSIPNYGNAISTMNYFKIIKNKLFTKEYIMLYLGVTKEHLGLGRALAECMKEELKKNKCTSIGALIKDGNANKVYFKELVDKEYKYILLNKKLK